MSVREILEAGLTELQARPWIRGGSYDPDTGGVCAAGALYQGAKSLGLEVHWGTGLETWAATYRLLLSVLSGWTLRIGTAYTIQAWNDHMAESKEDVVDRFKEAIKLAIDREIP